MPTRRQVIATLAATSAAGQLLPDTAQAAPAAAPSFVYCLNMSTVRGQKLGFIKELEVAAQAGFGSVEIWLDVFQEYLKNGGTVNAARQKLQDLGLKVEQAIGFASWIVDDAATRAKALEQMKREMELLAQIGCLRMAAPPVGVQSADSPALDLQKAAERYRAILDLSDQTGVVPHLELWGFSKNLSRLSEVMYVAVESGHRSARLLLDVYHLYRGGSSLESLVLVGKPAVEIFHVNDYTADFTPQAITDADRVYMGDGVAPLGRILAAIKRPDRPVVLSLELFNKSYYAQDALKVAQTGLAKMKAAVEKP